MKRQGVLPLLCWCIAATGAFAAVPVDPNTYVDEIRYLASPQLKGRATPSPELEKAAEYIAKRFKSFGLKPPPGSISYEQEYTVHAAAKLGPENHLTVDEGGKKTTLKLAADFAPFRFSSHAATKAQVVFAGYGITAPNYNYDDYAGMDVRDKIVLILRHEPQENDANSVFAGKELTEHATFAIKAANAKAHGAKGVILVNDVFSHQDGKDVLAAFAEASGPTDAGVTFVQVKEPIAAQWLKDEGYDIAEIARGIDKDLKPHSFAMKLTADLSVDLERETKTVHNVAAYLPGETSEYVVIGAHYDHLGLGDEHSLAPSQVGTIHPGADDNASGTAGVIELARVLSKQPKQKRGVLFLTFSGEELGLLGSAWYVGHPLLPLKDAVTMINLDMIGRIRDGKVYITGAGTGDSLSKLIQDTPAPDGLKLDLSQKLGYAGSDHLSFTLRQVPVLFFFSGLHADYHKPSDTWDKIDSKDAAKLLDYVATIAMSLENAPGRPQFIRLSEPEGPASGDASGGSASGGYGPNFGSVPDFDEPPHGVRFADVRDGTPAAKAGLKAGDILVEFDGKDIANLYDFTFALRAHKAGDTVVVKVMRGTQKIEAKVLLTERR